MKTKLIKTISTSIPNLEGRNLKPLKEHAGAVLKLTTKDKKEISKIQASITELECDLYDVRKAMNKDNNSNRLDYFWNKIDTLEYRISGLRELIRDIKINRFNKQKSKLNQK